MRKSLSLIVQITNKFTTGFGMYCMKSESLVFLTFHMHFNVSPSCPTVQVIRQSFHLQYQS